VFWTGTYLPAQHLQLVIQTQPPASVSGASSGRGRGVRSAGHVPSVSQVVIFLPAEQVARAVGVHPSKLCRMLPALVNAGLSAPGRTRAYGTLWAIRLRGWRMQARLGYSDLKAKYRDLAAVIWAGRISWALIREAKKPTKGMVCFDLIRRFALPPSTEIPLSSLDSCTAHWRDLEAPAAAEATTDGCYGRF
jgi:hypothetical protein